MASGKEIRNKIKSVESTRKITKAMEMVAASKMRKAQDRMRAARPYGEKIRRVAANLSHALTDYKHPFLIKRDPVQVDRFDPVTSDKGLCGGLNTNVLRLARGQDEGVDAEGKKLQATCIGNKGLGFMQRAGRQGRLARHRARRYAAPREADRAGQGSARCLHEGRDRRALHRLYPLHQHDEAGAGVRAVAAAVRRAGRLPPRPSGTTSTNRMPRPSSTICWSVMSKL